MQKSITFFHLLLLPLLSFAQFDDVREIFFQVNETSITARWEYLCGQGVDYFTLQRQKQYNSLSKPQDIQTVEATCATGGYNPFSITDSMPLEGTSYYRVKLHYADGALVYSMWYGAQFGDLPDFLFKAYPSPALASETITFAWEMYNRDLVTLEVLDSQGKLVMEMPTQYLEQGEHQLIWKLAGIEKGLYLVRMRVGEETVIRKIWV